MLTAEIEAEIDVALAVLPDSGACIEAMTASSSGPTAGYRTGGLREVAQLLGHVAALSWTESPRSTT